MLRKTCPMHDRDEEEWCSQGMNTFHVFSEMVIVTHNSNFRTQEPCQVAWNCTDLSACQESTCYVLNIRLCATPLLGGSHRA